MKTIDEVIKVSVFLGHAINGKRKKYVSSSPGGEYSSVDGVFSPATILSMLNNNEISVSEYFEESKNVNYIKFRIDKNVDHPDHYGGAENPYEAIKVIEAWDLGFNLGNAVKYISRAGKKDPEKHIQDLEKAEWYLKREIEKLINLKKASK